MSTRTGTSTIQVALPYFGKEEEVAVSEVLRSGWVAQGPRVAEFEKKFASYVGAEEAIAVSSCTTALHLALLALPVEPGQEVICPSLSFIATANAVVHAGCKPVFVDIERDSYNIDPRKIEEAITPRTKAILLVHQIGLPAALNEILTIAKKHGLAVVEDAACAIGSEYFGRQIGAPHGEMACFSFHPRKILTTGEGGMITTRNPETAARLRRLRQHAMSMSDVERHSSNKVKFETYDEIGYNYRMTDLQAAVGLVQLGRMEGFLSRRRVIANRYAESFKRFGWMQTPKEPEGCRHNFQSYMVRIAKDAPIQRDELMQALLERGVSTRRGVMPIHREKPYKNAEWDKRLPETNAAADETIIFPLYYQMTDEDIEYVIECVGDVSRKR